MSTLVVGPTFYNSSSSKFAFSKQPSTTSVDTGTTVTLSCEAGGRTGITYQWYSLAAGFNVPPQDGDKISETGTTLEVAESSYSSGSMFQCMATVGEESIFSDVATVTFNIPAATINFSGIVTTDSVSTSDDISNNDAWVYTLKCNKDTGFDPDSQITSGSAYNVKWYKGGVEVADDNKWIYTYSGTNADAKKLGFDANDALKNTITLDQYSLVIFNIKSSDAGTYTCKAVNADGKSVTLGTVTISSVGTTIFDDAFYLKSKTSLAAGYTVQEDGTIKTTPSVGDIVVLSCGGICKPGGSTSNSISYKWTLEGDLDAVLTTDREYSVTVLSTSSVTYQCRITNIDCVDSTTTTKGAVSFTPTVQDATTTLTASPTSPSKGDTVTITCIVVGYPEPSQPVLSKDGGSDITFSEGCSGTNTKTCNHVINNAQYTHSGTYKCVGSNTVDGVDKTDPKTVDINVVGTEEVSMVVKNGADQTLTGSTIEISKGSTLKITCTVDGNPKPGSISLKKDGTAVAGTTTSETDYSRTVEVAISDLGLWDSGCPTVFASPVILGHDRAPLN
eukprot:sb/3463528/